MNTRKIILLIGYFIFMSFGVMNAQDDIAITHVAQKTAHLKSLFSSYRAQIKEHGINNNTLEMYKNCHADVFCILDSLYIDDDVDVHIQLDPRSHDNYIYIRKEVYVPIDTLMSYINIKDLSAESCWQWVLLYYITEFSSLSPYVCRFICSQEQWSPILDNLKNNVVPDSLFGSKLHIYPQIRSSQYESMQNFNPRFYISLNRTRKYINIRFYSWTIAGGLGEHRIKLKVVGNNKLKMVKEKYSIKFIYDLGLIG